MREPLVSVVMPAFNAAATIDAALESACAQTWPALEILVVDDGSVDGTADIVRRRMRADSRVRLLQQENAGPSAARNAAIAAASGSLIAPLDADDLWLPEKIALQTEALEKGGAQVGLCYSWFALIDERGRILKAGHGPEDSGAVLRACCRRNLVGNGSGALMRKQAVLECGSYDVSLRACEDLKLYTAIAERYHFAVVPRHLTGYRQTNTNATSEVTFMKASADKVLAALEVRHPQYLTELRQMRRDIYYWLLQRGIAAGRITASHAMVKALWRCDRRFAALAIPRLPLAMLDTFRYRFHGRGAEKVFGRQREAAAPIS